MRVPAVLPALCLATWASAQSGLYLDIGPDDVHGLPPETFGAAASLGGAWNALDTDALAAGTLPAAVGGLVDRSGLPSNVTVFVDDLGSGLDGYLFDAPGTTGGDDALLDDLGWFGGPAVIELQGVVPGSYLVYTYATVPDGSLHRTHVDVIGSIDPAQTVGGAFTGGYGLGVTHARHEIVVGTGGIVRIELSVATDFMSLNGIQLVPDGATGDLGASYCGPAPANSTVQSAVITAFGSPRRVDNDVTLTASLLPTQSFGYFLTSLTQGFVAGPGGSAGNLCLGGAIGRYVGPGQVQNSGASGSFSLVLDLGATPHPQLGLISIVPGETWHFQGWYRDSLVGIPVSNLTDGRSITFI